MKTEVALDFCIWPLSLGPVLSYAVVLAHDYLLTMYVTSCEGGYGEGQVKSALKPSASSDGSFCNMKVMGLFLLPSSRQNYPIPLLGFTTKLNG